MTRPPGGSEDDSGSGVNEAAVGAGVGVGIGVPAVLALVGILFCLRRKQRRSKVQQNTYTNAPSQPETETFQAKPPVSRVERKPVPSTQPSPRKTEISGQGVFRELSGREIHSVQDISPSAPLGIPGQHEMPAGASPREMEVSDSHRYELPDQRF